jgi:hypothetical protein
MRSAVQKLRGGDPHHRPRRPGDLEQRHHGRVLAQVVHSEAFSQRLHIRHLPGLDGANGQSHHARASQPPPGPVHHHGGVLSGRGGEPRRVPARHFQTRIVVFAAVNVRECDRPRTNPPMRVRAYHFCHPCAILKPQLRDRFQRPKTPCELGEARARCSRHGTFRCPAATLMQALWWNFTQPST